MVDFKMVTREFFDLISGEVNASRENPIEFRRDVRFVKSLRKEPQAAENEDETTSEIE